MKQHGICETHIKYPHLGNKECKSSSECHTSTSMINRGEALVPSDDFSSNLLVMRDVFKGMHNESLREGEDCIKALSSEMQCAVGDEVPLEVINFFAKISVFSKMRRLNHEISVYDKKKRKECKSMLGKELKYLHKEL